MRLPQSIGLALVLAFPSAPIGAATVSQIVVFGDGDVDIGRAASELAPQDGLIPAPNTVGGRYSDGLLLPEYLTGSLGISQLNFAVRGATTGLENLSYNINHDLRETGVLSQVAEYTTMLGGSLADPDALHLVWAGAADIAGEPKTNTAAITAAVNKAEENLLAAVTQLDALGASRIVLATATPRPDVSDAEAPNVEPNLFEKADAATRQMNTMIRTLAAGLNSTLSAEVVLFDSYAAIRDLIDESGTNGFAPYTHTSSGYCINNANCDQLINWDVTYKTTATHGALADTFIDDLELLEGDLDQPGDTAAPVSLPAAGPLLGGALLGIVMAGSAGWRRRTFKEGENRDRADVRQV